MQKLLKDLMNFVVGLVEVLLVARVILKLLAADGRAPVVKWIYDMTQPLLQPFLPAFPTPAIRGGYVLEFTTLFAIFAYAFLGYLIQEILEILDKRK